jgi:hypothetical protein
MATIEFDLKQGDIPHYGPMTEEISRPGQDGQTYLHVGRRGMDTELVIFRRLADQSAWDAYNTAVLATKAGKHTLSHLVDGWTQEVYVKEIIPITRVSQPLINASDGSTKQWVGRLIVAPTA